MLAFFLFGSLLIMVTVSIQNDLAKSLSGSGEISGETGNSALNSSLAIGVIILYTFFALFLFVAKWNRSIKRMENYLIDIGSGTFPAAPLKISGGDELSEMADVINEMK